jgi:glycosyltransferase involved in cell wall biosynthesis
MTDRPGPIAYLTGEYPKVSHTFIQREVLALRDHGYDIRTCSVRRAPDKDINHDQTEELANTFFVLDEAKSPVHLLRCLAGQMIQAPGATFRALKLAWRTRAPGAKAALWQMFYFLEAVVLARHLREIGAKHLHNHFVDSSCTVAMLTSEMTSIPFSFTLHGPTELFEPAIWRLDEKIARAAFSVYISHFARSQGMLFSDPVHWDRMRIVHCGITPDIYGTKREGRTPDKTLLFVGRLAAVKGVVILLEAFARLRAAHPDAQLRLVGDGPERTRLEAQAQTLKLEEAVSFLGYLGQEDVIGELDKADMLVLPSFAEGVPVVLMEAMASRIPVVASRVAGVQELVEDGVSGYTLPPGDTDALTATLDTLLADSDKRTTMGQAGRARVEAEFTIIQEAAWLGQLIEGSLRGALPDGLRMSPKAKAGNSS